MMAARASQTRAAAVSCRRTRRCWREIFRDSIAELTDEDYSEAQQEAWAAAADDEAAFAQAARQQLTLVARLEGSAVGFASLAGGDKIDMLYVHPAAAGQGVGTMLIDALEKLAGARGAAKLDRRCQRHRARLLREARLCRAAAQFGFGRRRMARQHHACTKATFALRQTGGLMTKPDTPFPRHWLYYIVLKYARASPPRCCSRSTSSIGMT